MDLLLVAGCARFWSEHRVIDMAYSNGECFLKLGWILAIKKRVDRVVSRRMKGGMLTCTNGNHDYACCMSERRPGTIVHLRIDQRKPASGSFCVSPCLRKYACRRPMNASRKLRKNTD